MEDNKNYGLLIGVFILILVVSIILVINFLFLDNIQGNLPVETAEAEQSVLANANSAQTLSPTAQGISSLTATAKNQTWLEFDGGDDVTVASTFTIISFWYKNATTDWQHIVNSSGTTYVNGSAAEPLLYPVTYDGVDYVIGSGLDVDVDDFRVYNETLNSNEVMGLYLLGR